MIFKDKYCEQFIHGYAEATVNFSQNTAYSILGIWDLIHYNFYCNSLSDYVNKVEKNLQSENFLDVLKVFQSNNYFESLNDSRFVMFKIKLFDYYLSRLPVLRLTTFNGSSGKYKLGIDDIKAISNLSYTMVNRKYNKEMKKYEFSGLYRRFMNFSKYPKPLRYFYSHKIEDLLYDYTWLIDFFKSYYPEYLCDNNINNYAIHVLENCFPMFWDTFRQNIAQSLFYSINLGYVNGTKDLDELISKGN